MEYEEEQKERKKRIELFLLTITTGSRTDL